MLRRPPRAARFPYTTLFRSHEDQLDEPDETLSAVITDTGGATTGTGTATGTIADDDAAPAVGITAASAEEGDNVRLDRKSTRLNSSHPHISSSAFCFEKILL